MCMSHNHHHYKKEYAAIFFYTFLAKWGKGSCYYTRRNGTNTFPVYGYPELT